MTSGQDTTSAIRKSPIVNHDPSGDSQNKLLLETSFGHHYLDVSNNRSYYPLCSSSSKASSLAGSTLKNNQTYDIHSLSTSDRGRSPSVPSDATTVIFADDIANNRNARTSNSLQCLSYDLHVKSVIKQNYTAYEAYEAPLASPETLSEISSISSKTSVDHSDSNVFESQLHTPKVMRRALKFTENLSMCANDKRNLDQYKRLGRVFITNPLEMLHQQSSDNQSVSSNESYETAKNQTRPFENSKSADNIDNDLETKPQKLDKKLTFSDSTCINEMQDDCLNNIQRNMDMDSKYKISSNETFYSAKSSKSSIEKLQATITSENTVQNEETGILESHFPVYTLDDCSGSVKASNGNLSSNNSIPNSKIYRNDDKMFLYNESLPLLSNLSERSRPLQKFNKRKGCVYPESNILGSSQSIRSVSKNESNV